MKKKRLIFLIFCLFIFSPSVMADSYTYHVRIKAKGTNLRYDAGGTTNAKVASLDKDDYYELVTNTEYPDINNHKRCNGGWYHMTYYTGKTGYVCSDDVELIKSYSKEGYAPSTSCETEMQNAGFPSSYWGGLCSLKEKHPSWNFQAIKVNLDWTYIVNKESDCGTNYIYNKTLDKSFFDTSCTKTSPGGYVAPSQKAIAFYMDPRNFFTEKYMFQFLDQSFDASYESIYNSSVYNVLKNTEVYKYHLARGNDLPSIITSSSKDKASPISMAVRIYQELGTGTNEYDLYSGVTSGYEGYYNFFNFGVSDNCTSQNGRIYCGLGYAAKMGWNSVANAISGGVNAIAGSYIQKGQYTGYLQKYNVTPTNGNTISSHQYMTNVAAPMSESKVTTEAFRTMGILENNLIFKIPVYQNMSETINNSNSGAGEVKDDTSNVSVPVSTVVTSSGYRYSSGFVSGIDLGEDVSTLISKISSVGAQATVYNQSGSILQSGVLATGYKVNIKTSSNNETLEVVIKGDTSGDGKINALDLLQVQKNILGTFNLSSASSLAADTSGDGKINALDLLQIQKSILGTYTISK